MGASAIPIPSQARREWQDLVQLVAHLLRAPAALITRLDGQDVEVVCANSDPGNPYTVGQRRPLADCFGQAVLTAGEVLAVSDARPARPEAGDPMIAYLGFPIFGPDETVFGEICALDRTHNPWPDDQQLILQQFRDLVQTQLHLFAAQDELERKNQELRQRLSEIETLHGIIPICARCKNIRDDDGYWQRVEDYIRARSHANFSHSLCPVCLEHYLQDVDGSAVG